MARKLIRTLYVVLLFAVTATPVMAAPVDRFGTTVDYLAIEESVQDNTSGGTPTFDPAGSTIVGDSLSFSPKSFSSSSNGGGIDVTDVQLNFILMSHAGYGITDLKFEESGDYTLIGSGTDTGSGTNLTQVNYSLALASVKVLEVDGVVLGVPVSGAVTDSGTKYLQDPEDPPVSLWDLTVDFDIEQLLIDNSIPYALGATKVEVAIDNQLIARSEESSFAYVAKKDFQGVGITVITIPEPSAVGILSLSVLGIGTWRRRRS